MFEVRACAVVVDGKNIVLEWIDNDYWLPCVEVEENSTPQELLKKHLAGGIRAKVFVNEIHGTLFDHEKRRLALLYTADSPTTLTQQLLSSSFHVVDFGELKEESLEPRGAVAFIKENSSGELLRLKNIVEKSINNCPWVERHLFSQAVVDLVSEIEELEEALASRQKHLVSAELGDVFYDAMLAVWIFCRENNMNPSEILRTVGNKISWRKPWLFDETQITLEEAEHIWQDRKSRE